ncbi:unnamed protein product [Zymoseptoria tritici ST99CH_3D1]|uniref:Uncharacterized protein n=3 Tax=Zymoseptoria tritici TaxID=1047171 RepID=F9XKK3_ZYMTI|nr:uncharacterized protein MYCGRDRAFT_96011 [Zymoseptoria tritici IPO323]EGP84220.1 hypothetical protein MYCGRDRAFT_96011 [Zymoseptoria tritici IPO323]SMQ54425.1 unnamed protein product [Zymoseptoria tritici ST99CH_3D7]SMR58857.1 unnamed protein product [Zymoseptoria tritici ST99CH_1E4]SMR62697.1 unnamed protein product [Zymoseptoria tritici ST99CH_3D1]
MATLRIFFSFLICALAILSIFPTSIHLVTQTIEIMCKAPLVNHFISCAPSQQFQVFPNPIFANIIAQNVELASMREAASDIAAFPYQLAIGHSDFKDMIFEISAEDLPFKQLLWPLLKSFNKLTDGATDSVQRSVSLTNALIDNTIIVHSWARDKLQLDEAREKSFPSPLPPIARAIGLDYASEDALLQVFTLTTSQLVRQTNHVLVQHEATKESLVELRDLLDRIAFALKPEEHSLKREKLDDASYWKALLSHRSNLPNFDKKMETCARFYDYTLRAGKAVAETSVALHDVRSKVKGVQEEVERSPMSLASSGTSLRQTIFSLGVSIANLEEFQRISRAEQEKRMQTFDSTLDGFAAIA